MNILQVAPRFSTAHGGGGVVAAYNLAKGLISKGHKVGIATSDYQYDADYAESLSALMLTYKSILNVASLHITPLFLRDITCDCWANIDIIHMQSCRTFQNIIAHHYARKYKIPYIIEAHGLPKTGARLRRLLQWLFDVCFSRTLIRDASVLIAETRVGMEEYGEIGADQQKIIIVPCPYDLSIFDKLPDRGQFKRIKNECGLCRVVLYLGGLEYIKGIDLLIKAFAKLDTNDVKLVIVGAETSYKKSLDKLVDSLGISEMVIFTGGLYGQAKLEALVDADVAVFPSRAEQGLPFAALEAIMCDTPVLVTSGTGAAEDIVKMGGGVVKPDINAIAAGIKRLLYSELGEGMVQKGQQYIKDNLSLDNSIGVYEDIYKGCFR